MLCRKRLLMAFAVVAITTAVSPGQLMIVDTLPGEFIDISDTGQSLNLSGNLSAEFITDIGNEVLPAGRIVVGNNGGIAFDPLDDYLSPFNEEIPSDMAFGGWQGLLPYWDNIGNDIGDVVYGVVDDVLIIQWHDKPLADVDGTVRFQVKIFDEVKGPVPIYAQFIYADVEQPGPNGGASATIGYQNGPAAFNDVQWSFNTAGAVSNGTVLSLTTPTPGAFALLTLGLMRSRRRRLN